jgi:hypothetical protein
LLPDSQIVQTAQIVVVPDPLHVAVVMTTRHLDLAAVVVTVIATTVNAVNSALLKPRALP